VSSTSRTVRLFKATDNYVRLNGRTVQVYADTSAVALDSVLQHLTIESSYDRSTVAESIPVTSSMVTWDRAFDNRVAGTYTGTITYEGQVLGTVAVTITSVHSYETVVTAPTCTAQGYTSHICTDCGYSYTDAYVEATGHHYTSAESNGYMVYTCSGCGDTYSEKLNRFSNVSTLASGKDHVITLYSNGKYYALSHANNTLSLVQITVSDGQITSDVDDHLRWTYSNNKLSYTSSGSTRYLYAQSSGWWWWTSTTLTLSTSSSSSVSFSNNRLQIGSSYLSYSSGSAALSSSGSDARIFAEN
jgi:transposase-like protein